MTQPTKPCRQCGKTFEKTPSESMPSWRRRHKYCSPACHALARKGVRVSKKTEFKKGKPAAPHKGDCVCIRCKPDRTKNPKWKGGQVAKECLQCGSTFKVDIYRTETARFCSRPCAFKHKTGKPMKNSGQFKPKWSTMVTGVPRKELLKAIRNTPEYKNWRRKVYEKGGFTCVLCGDKRGGNLEADHIYPLSKLVDDHKIKSVPEARRSLKLWDVKNGRTLCIPCHKDTETYGVKPHPNG